MKAKLSRHGLRALGIALAMASCASAHAAEPSRALRVVSSRLVDTGAGVQVETRVSRTLRNTLLTSRQLRIALVAADGSVRAEQRRVVGPAQLSRHGARDAFLSVALNTKPEPQDHLEVEWLANGR